MNEPSPEEKHLGKVIGAFNDLHIKYGDDADQFIDYDALLRNRKIVEHCRRSVENSISRQYLPGFRFKSTDHARWHFNNRDKLSFWIMDVDYGEEYYAENWIRAAFVSSYKQYGYEVARALKQYDESTKDAVRDYRAIVKTGNQTHINRAATIMKIRRSGRNLPPGPVNFPGDLMAIDPWTIRISKLFTKDVLPTTLRSLNRWPDQALARRQSRRKSDPPSGWYIDYISYFGEIPCPDGHDPDIWIEKFHGYFESWKWESIPGVPNPKRTTQTFLNPASPDLWNQSATRTKYKFDL